MRKFLETYFGDNDIGAVITGRTYPGDRQDFTSNRRLLLAAVDKFAGEPLDLLELAELMEMTARIPGTRKTVLWFGGPKIDAFDLIDYQGGVLPTRDAEAAHAAMAAATRGNIRFYLVDPSGIDAEVGKFGPGCVEDTQNYRALAAMTGGFAVTNTNTFDDAFRRLTTETSTYYLLGFESTTQRKNGRYVRLEVRAKRPGLVVRSRTGYLEQLQYNRRRSYTEPARTPAEAALANPMATAGVGIRVFAAPHKGEDGAAVVVLAIDLDASTLTFSKSTTGYSTSVDVRHLAIDSDHKIFPEYRHRATVNVDDQGYLALKKSSIRVISQFEVPKGRYQVRVAAASGTQNGSVVYDLEVPDFADGPLTLGGISVAAASSGAITLRAGARRRSNQQSRQCRAANCEPSVILEGSLVPWRTGIDGNDFSPLDVSAAAPSTNREFAPSETLVLFTELYDNNRRVNREGEYTLLVTSEILDRTGSLVKEVTETRSSRARRRANGGHAFTLRIPLDGLSRGPHVARVKARSDNDPLSLVSRVVPFRVR
jgi:hypothetical protein